MTRYFIYPVLLLWALVYFLNILCDNVEVPRNECTCVPYYQCSDESGDIITDGRGIFDLRILETSSCKGYFDVCCNMTKESFNKQENIFPKFSGCGYQYSGYSPWYAAVLHQESDFSFSYKCGASLIHPQVILTAAHCFYKKDIKFSVKVGSAFVKIQKIIVHPKFNNYTMKNDIALAVLQDSIHINDKINTICIPPHGSFLDNSECSATVRIKGKKSAYLKMLSLKIISKDVCVNKLRSTRLGPFFQLHDSFICTQGQIVKDTCGGDGGSPLICPVPGQPDRFHQAGIVSWGVGCGEDNSPEVYVKVSIFRDWIDKEMLKLGLDITSYRY